MARQVTKVMGVVIANVRMECVDAALVKHKLETTGTDSQKIGRLAAHYRETVDKKRMADCSTCGGVSDVQEPACPFCGDGAVEGPATPHPDQTLTPPPPPPLPPLPQAAIVHRVAEVPVQIVKHTEADLNVAVARVQELKLAASERLWELGEAVKHIFDTELWKQRAVEDGAPKYKTWGMFAETELGITHSYSFKLMDVASSFTREEVRLLGPTKLYLTLTVPKEKQAKLLAAAGEGASVKELGKMAEEEGKEKRKTGRTGKGGAGQHKADGKKGGRKPEKITVAMLCTRVEIPLLKGADPSKRAKSIADMPTGEERMFNGVKQRFVVTKGEDGALLLVVERVRE